MSRKIDVYTVDDDVPAPVGIPPIGMLEVGESMAFTRDLYFKVASKATTVKKKDGKVFKIRKIDADRARIWRIA